jgi:hypothetical protein
LGPGGVAAVRAQDYAAVLDYCIHDRELTKANPYGFKASFNPTYPAPAGTPHGGVSPWHIA